MMMELMQFLLMKLLKHFQMLMLLTEILLSLFLPMIQLEAGGTIIVQV